MTNLMSMNNVKSTMAQQIAKAAIAFEQRRTGNHVPKSVTVVLSEGTLVITLHEALSPAERALAKNPAGAAQVQEFHRQLFASASDSLRREIQRITGMEVREATAEIEPASGAVVQAFTTGNVVQVFQLAGSVPTDTWSGSEPDIVAEKTKHPCSVHHRNAALRYEAAAYDHRRAAHHHDHGNHEEAKKHATAANGHSQDADRHSETAHQHSPK
jgi:uncharacterized protein YbcI